MNSIHINGVDIMKMQMKNFLTFCLMVMIVGLTLGNTKCGKVDKDALIKAEKASLKIAGYANDGVNLTRELMNSSILTPEQTNQVADLFIYLARGGQAFDKRVADMKTFFEKSGTEPDKATLARLGEYFRSDVIIRFTEIIDFIRSVVKNDQLDTVLRALKTAILIVAEVLNIGSATRVDLAGV